MIFSWAMLIIEWVSEWVSEWLLFNDNSAIFQLYHGENKLIFNVHFVLDQHAELDCCSPSSNIVIFLGYIWIITENLLLVFKMRLNGPKLRNCCFSELGLQQANSACWSSSKCTLKIALDAINSKKKTASKLDEQ
jgi:hypothetical protein